ncbi:hypothetical protein DERF_009288 [Dermatophagoides farinae]|uniref:Uncharacterized protein n=1 Tax=Dermatophagoides farinae TaxID=6954 RepID=A0A922HYU8_DERFA|nr:hypothetical protein DERF_009288 [Dermatophagoides farinae]
MDLLENIYETNWAIYKILFRNETKIISRFQRENKQYHGHHQVIQLLCLQMSDNFYDNKVVQRFTGSNYRKKNQKINLKNQNLIAN